MSDKNKKFRNHCDIDVLLDKEQSSVSVKVNYKPEMFQRPLDRQRHRYSLSDIKEELERQGITIDVDSTVSLTPHGGVIDNTSHRQNKHSLNVTFKMNKPTTKAKKSPSSATPPNPSPSSTKKTTKTTAKTTNK